MPVLWAARHNTWLLTQLTPKAVISFFLVMPVKPSSRGVQSLGLGCYGPWGWGVTVLGVGVLRSLGLGCYGPWGAASPFDYRTHLALLLRLGRGAPPAEGRGGLGPLSAGASPAAAASLSALPSQYSLHSCCGSSASMASVNCTDTIL